jgi:hypothetical protein
VLLLRVFDAYSKESYLRLSEVRLRVGKTRGGETCALSELQATALGYEGRQTAAGAGTGEEDEGFRAEESAREEGVAGGDSARRPIR